MANNSSQLYRFLAGAAGHVKFATLVLAGAVAFASVAAAADSFEVARVESISGNSSGLEFMDYLRLGQLIRLNPHETIVLSYKDHRAVWCGQNDRARGASSDRRSGPPTGRGDVASRQPAWEACPCTRRAGD
jgi:hypothetical protein